MDKRKISKSQTKAIRKSYAMRLQTKRLILRESTLKDAGDISENLNDLEVSRYIVPGQYPYTIQDAKKSIIQRSKMSKKKLKENYILGIELKSEKKIIGEVLLLKVNIFQGTAEVGYWLGKRYWGQGIMTEAIEKILEFSFNKLKLRRLTILTPVANTPSNKLAKKLGFKFEGKLREVYKSKVTGKIYDANLYSLLRKEWNKNI